MIFRRFKNTGGAMIRRVIAFVAATALLLAAAPLQAQDTGQPQKGRVLAQQLCAECHAVQKGSAGSPNEKAPRFETIAAVSGMTGIALRAALQTSHRTMPNVTLEPNDLADIVAYILSLKNG
jgi:mono/diheme cytochrome c family protein